MRTEISRRELLFGVGGMVVAGSIAVGLVRQEGHFRGLRGIGQAPCCAPVELDGWLITAQDKEALLAMD